MKNFCSIADYNFRNKILALNQSLKRFNKNYILNVLCLDDALRDYLLNLRDDNIRIFEIDNLLNADEKLLNCKNNNPSKEALINTNGNFDKAKELQFIWALTPYFTWYCLENLQIDDILYIDSDIYFFSPWTQIYESTKTCSIGIVEHRCHYNPSNGKYNVGIVYFKNDLDGYKCLTWWKNWLLTTNHKFYSTHSSCGDQKYLELFEDLFSNVKVLDCDLGHLAPWNYSNHSYINDKIVWNDKEQELLYCHFSNFFVDYKNQSFIPAKRHGLVEIKDEYVKKINEQYFKQLMDLNNA